MKALRHLHSDLKEVSPGYFELPDIRVDPEDVEELLAGVRESAPDVGLFVVRPIGGLQTSRFPVEGRVEDLSASDQGHLWIEGGVLVRLCSGEQAYANAERYQLEPETLRAIRSSVLRFAEVGTPLPSWRRLVRWIPIALWNALVVGLILLSIEGGWSLVANIVAALAALAAGTIAASTFRDLTSKAAVSYRGIAIRGQS